MVPRRTRNCQENMALLLRLNTPPYLTASKIYTSLFDHPRLYVVSTDTHRDREIRWTRNQILYLWRDRVRSWRLAYIFALQCAARDTFAAFKCCINNPHVSILLLLRFSFFPLSLLNYMSCVLCCVRGEPTSMQHKIRISSHLYVDVC